MRVAARVLRGVSTAGNASAAAPMPAPLRRLRRLNGRRDALIVMTLPFVSVASNRFYRSTPIARAPTGISDKNVCRMNPAFAGALSALSLGTADFACRFSTRAVGAPAALVVVLTTGAVLLSHWIAVTGAPLVWPAEVLPFVALNGVSTTVMTLLLYKALARGPISVAAPIVASHPVLVVIFWVAVGARPGALQWAAMAVTILGAVTVAATAEKSVTPADRKALNGTIGLSCAAALAYAQTVPVELVLHRHAAHFRHADVEDDAAVHPGVELHEEFQRRSVVTAIQPDGPHQQQHGFPERTVVIDQHHHGIAVNPGHQCPRCPSRHTLHRSPWSAGP